MHSLPTLLSKFLPVFCYIGLGFIGKRWLSLSQAKVGLFLFYVFVPLVVFKGALLSDTGAFLVLIALSFSVSLTTGLLARWTLGMFKDELSEGVLKCTFSYFNIGWFGIPIVYALFGDDGAVIMTGLYVGGMLFGNTIGYLWVTQNPANQQPTWKKLSRIPALYAMLLGFSLHFSPYFEKLSISPILRGLLDFSTLATSVLGMGLVGMSVAHVAYHSVAWRKLGSLLLLRIVFAFLVVGIIAGAAFSLGLLTPLAFKIMWLMPLLPIAANILVFTSRINQENEFVGLVLLFSTILSCVLIGAAFVVLAI